MWTGCGVGEGLLSNCCIETTVCCCGLVFAMSPTAESKSKYIASGMRVAVEVNKQDDGCAFKRDENVDEVAKDSKGWQRTRNK